MMRWTSLLAVVLMFAASQTVHANLLERILGDVASTSAIPNESEVIVEQGTIGQFAGYRYRGFGMTGWHSGFHGGWGECGCGHGHAWSGCGHRPLFTRHACSKPAKCHRRACCRTRCCETATSCGHTPCDCGCSHRHRRWRCHHHACGCGCDAGAWSGDSPAEAAGDELGDPPAPPVELDEAKQARVPRAWLLPRTTGLLPLSVE